MNYQKNAFTLVELIVWIAIIWLISLWITNMYSSNLPDRQKLDLFTNKVVWIIDSVKNYSLVWKWIWTDLITPNYFKMELSRSGSYLKTFFNTWGTDIYYSPMSINPFDTYYNINSIKCIWLDYSSWAVVDDISITYNWSNITLSWCLNNYQKIIDLELAYKWFKKTIRLNSISWVLEEIKRQ